MTTGNSIPGMARLIVIVNTCVFLAFGASFLLFPAQLAGQFGIELTSPSAFADLRAMYGGMCLAVGVLMLQGLRNQAWFAPALFITMLSSGCLASARIFSMLTSGMPDVVVLVALATEVVSFVWAFAAYRGLSSSGSQRPLGAQAA